MLFCSAKWCVVGLGRYFCLKFWQKHLLSKLYFLFAPIDIMAPYDYKNIGNNDVPMKVGIKKIIRQKFWISQFLWNVFLFSDPRFFWIYWPKIGLERIERILTSLYITGWNKFIKCIFWPTIHAQLIGKNPFYWVRNHIRDLFFQNICNWIRATTMLIYLKSILNKK